VAHPVRDAETNIHGSLNVLQNCVKHGAKKIIFSSSGGAIYHGLDIRPTPENVPAMPLTPYGVAKLAFEMYLHAACHQHGLEWAALRYANAYAPRQGAAGEGGVIGVFAKRMLADEPVTIFGDGKQTRDFVYVDDVVETNILAMRPGLKGVYNISTGKETTVNEAAALLKKATGYARDIMHGPAVAGEERFSCLDASSAKAAFGWEAKIGIEEGIGRTVRWFKSEARSAKLETNPNV
jgi:UDP-glucose 4-epimerase